LTDFAVWFELELNTNRPDSSILLVHLPKPEYSCGSLSVVKIHMAATKIPKNNVHILQRVFIFLQLAKIGPVR
jgi:hypothetical protein